MHDLAVVGSGFGGALTAMIAARLGLKVIMLERGTHPRFAIGESSTPLTNIVLETLARKYDLPRLLPLTKYGPWKRTYPAVGVGLKRGFSFYHHDFGLPFANLPDRSDQLLAAASPHEEIADTHWYRPDFDWFLVREAIDLGVEYVDLALLNSFERTSAGCQLSGTRDGKPLQVDCKFTVDATGPNGFLTRSLDLPHGMPPHMPPTQGLFTHFRNVRLFRDVLPPQDGILPYPLDASALHHIFEGGWIWVLRFDNGITSAGVAATAEIAAKYRFDEGEPAWHRLLADLPSVKEQFAETEVMEEWRHARRLPFRSQVVSGPGFTMLPSAASFIDPLFSTGFALTLLGIQRIAEAIETSWGTPGFELQMREHEAATLAESDAAAELVGAAYEMFGSFPLFVGIGTFYLAAVSYAETCYRLGDPERASGFLAHRDANFVSAFRKCVEEARRLKSEGLTESGLRGYFDLVRRSIEPRNIAGLANASRRNWYPVVMDDLVRNSHKLGRSAEEMEEFMQSRGLDRYR